jgi:phosphatidylglycerophosphatase A
LSRWFYWIATGFGIGRFPIAPGTAGSLAGLALVLLLRPFSLHLYIGLFLLTVGLGVYCAGRTERALGVRDDPAIVIDEIAGMLLAVFLIPAGTGFLAGGFVLFRALDILKPFPARWVQERIAGGWGVMLDDLVAGAYANLILQAAGRWIL